LSPSWNKNKKLTNNMNFWAQPQKTTKCRLKTSIFGSNTCIFDMYVCLGDKHEYNIFKRWNPAKCTENFMKYENFQIPVSTFHLYYLITIHGLSIFVSTVYLKNIIIYSETSLCGHLIADQPIDFCWKWISLRRVPP